MPLAWLSDEPIKCMRGNVSCFPTCNTPVAAPRNRSSQRHHGSRVAALAPLREAPRAPQTSCARLQAAAWGDCLGRSRAGATPPASRVQPCGDAHLRQSTRAHFWHVRNELDAAAHERSMQACPRPCPRLTPQRWQGAASNATGCLRGEVQRNDTSQSTPPPPRAAGSCRGQCTLGTCETQAGALQYPYAYAAHYCSARCAGVLGGRRQQQRPRGRGGGGQAVRRPPPYPSPPPPRVVAPHHVGVSFTCMS